MSMSRSRTAAIVTGAAMLWASLAGSGSASASPAGDRVTVEFPYLWTGPEGKALQKLVDQFNKSQNKISVHGFTAPDSQKQLTQMASTNGFDISDNFGSTVGSWASKGIVASLDDYMKKDKFATGDFVPAAMRQMKYQGKTYALPVAVHTILLLYNKDLFKKAKIAGPPKTVSQWTADIKKLTKTDSHGNLTQLGLSTPDFITLAYAFGGDWARNGKPTPDDAHNIAALSWWVNNVVKKYGVNQIKKFESGFGEYASPQNPFYVGKVAMTLDGEWQAQFIKEYAPKLHWGAVSIPYPNGHSNLAGTTQLSTSMFFIPTNAKHKDEAWTFLKYLESKQAMTAFTYALANLPARKSLLAASKYHKIPGFSLYLNSLRSHNLKIFTNAPWGAEYGTDLTSAIGYVTDLKQTPKDAMEKVKSEIAPSVGS